MSLMFIYLSIYLQCFKNGFTKVVSHDFCNFGSKFGEVPKSVHSGMSKTLGLLFWRGK